MDLEFKKFSFNSHGINKKEKITLRVIHRVRIIVRDASFDHFYYFCFGDIFDVFTFWGSLEISTSVEINVLIINFLFHDVHL